MDTRKRNIPLALKTTGKYMALGRGDWGSLKNFLGESSFFKALSGGGGPLSPCGYGGENFSWAHFYSFLETKLKVKLGGGGSVPEIIFCMGILALKTLSPIPTPRAINANDTFDERTVALSQLERNQKRKGVSFYFFLLSAILHSAVASSKAENAPSLG